MREGDRGKGEEDKARARRNSGEDGGKNDKR